MVNTDQAFDFLREAGVTEDICIQTVRRWLRERKINYQGSSFQRAGYILGDTDEAFELLKDAGVSESIGIQMVRRWLREGKIENVGNGDRFTEFLSHDSTPKPSFGKGQDKIIQQLKVKLKAQDEQIIGMEKIHQTSIHTLIQQRNKLKKEMIQLENDKSELQKETKKLLKENIDLRNELLKLKEELSKGNKTNREENQDSVPLTPKDHRQKLGLSRTASEKEVLTGYKKLLKVTHPDHGGHAAAFHYIKTDFDDYRAHSKR
jgi:regulator of replication initiation timing